jgi:DNA-binding transcriptional ArsR family regulator
MMKDSPDIVKLGCLIGDPARTSMLTALLSGQALTPSELAAVAGVTLPTTSAHLSKLSLGGLVAQRQQGRHRYFSLADEKSAALLERMMGLASEKAMSVCIPVPEIRLCARHVSVTIILPVNWLYKCMTACARMAC